MFNDLMKKIVYFFTKSLLVWLGEKIVPDVAITSDTWSYLDDDFHVEITDELYHHCLAQVYDKGNVDTEMQN